MSREPDFFEDLRRVGAFKKGLLGGRPADHALSKIPEAQVSRDTIGAWLRGNGSRSVWSRCCPSWGRSGWRLGVKTY